MAFNKNINTNQLFKKLDYKILDLFEIISKKNVFLELKLLQLIKVYNIFYLNLFQKTILDLLINPVNKFLPLVIIINKEKWKFEEIFYTRNYWKKI